MAPVAEISQPPIPPEAFDRFPGKWVAIREGQVVADADTLEALEGDDRVKPSDTRFRVPERDAKFF